MLGCASSGTCRFGDQRAQGGESGNGGCRAVLLVPAATPLHGAVSRNVWPSLTGMASLSKEPVNVRGT